VITGNDGGLPMTKPNIAPIPANHQPAPIEVTEQSFEYLGDNTVMVSLKTKGGQPACFTISIAAFVQGLNHATQVMNANLASVLADLGM
jgi:hypothetical protein